MKYSFFGINWNYSFGIDIFLFTGDWKRKIHILPKEFYSLEKNRIFHFIFHQIVFLSLFKAWSAIRRSKKKLIAIYVERKTHVTKYFLENFIRCLILDSIPIPKIVERRIMQKSVEYWVRYFYGCAISLYMYNKCLSIFECVFYAPFTINMFEGVVEFFPAQ